MARFRPITAAPTYFREPSALAMRAIGAASNPEGLELHQHGEPAYNGPRAVVALSEEVVRPRQPERPIEDKACLPAAF